MTALNRPPSPRHLTAFVLVLAGSLVAAYALPGAQAPAKKALTIDDYTKWRSIAGQKMSGDGKWVAYTLAARPTSIAAEAKPVLHLLNLETSADVTVDDATDADFSPDSKWIAYQVDPGAAQRARASRNALGSGGPGTPPQGGGGAAQPGAPAGAPGQSGQSGQAGQTGQAGRGGGAAAIPPRRVELRNLATGAVRSWQDIGSFIFSPASTHLFLRRRGADAARRRRRARRRRARRRRRRAAAEAAARPAPAGHGRRRAAARPAHGRPSVARQRGRHRVQPHGRAAGLHRERRGEGRQRGLRVRHAQRAHHRARQRREDATTASSGTRRARRSPCSRAATSRRCASATTCCSPSPTSRRR